MSVAINSVSISGGPLPEGDLCAYSYDPLTSCVFLTRLLDDAAPVETPTMSMTAGSIKTITYTGTLYKGILKLIFTSISVGVVGNIKLVNSASQTIFDVPLESKASYGNACLSPNTFGYQILDNDTYTLTITNATDKDMQLVSLLLQTGAAATTTYAGNFDQTPALTGLGSLVAYTATIAALNPINTSWGYTRKNGRHIGTQMLAPFPPPFYDANWYNMLDYPETTNYVINYINYKAQSFFDSETFITTPDLSKAVKLIDDIYARPTPTMYSIAIITQETIDRQLMWLCNKETRVKKVDTTNYNYNVNTWSSSEKVYKYKAAGVYFGGKDYNGPLNSILYDSQDGVTRVESKILDMNEFPVNANNETYVHAYVSNYSSSAPKVYCVLNKTTGRMAEIDPISKVVRYFTLVVPNDSEIKQLYYANRLMYTIYNNVNASFSLYDANNNGVLLYTFDVGTYNPAIVPQFSIIN